MFLYDKIKKEVKNFMLDNMSFVWLSVIIILSIVELATTQLFSICFVFSSIITLVISLFFDSILLQLSIFLILSIVFLSLTTSFAKKLMNFPKTKTNADKNVGKRATVIRKIDNNEGNGLVKVEETIWSAKSGDDSVILENTKVIVEKIEGVKLVVKRI